ncbi:high frequency lysogenization protein HflD [Halochromatium salexigens]|uniref:High frequency lysogenization protein HflD homolog n=1 Tax=Halochromatium salexigens TaxID=49447 RepID=A0AAJ0UF05_HALSE|nr:high frequency lysogenization protein HflD [Halochromatium salexigens]MBK5930244.1 lysogenization regulator HflD [Halochromatium salexigens]
MPYSDQDRIIALAGLHQAIHCVQRIANRGSVDIDQMAPCLHSLFQIDAEDVPSVFGEPGAVATGARQIIAQLTGQPERNMEMTRYVITLLKHERILAGRGDMLAAIGEGIEAAREARGDAPLIDREVIARFASLYSATISKLEPRIMVRGNPLYLQNEENQERIRALLLAGIRSAILWRQCGGRRMQILLGRRKVLDAARAYLSPTANLQQPS